MLLELNPYNLNPNLLDDVVSCLRKGGVVAIPTDTVYGFACDLKNKKALEKMARLKGIKAIKRIAGSGLHQFFCPRIGGGRARCKFCYKVMRCRH